MTALSGARDPAQPLVTLLDGPVRVELSGATAANWAAKTANFLETQGGPRRVGILLPLHWQAVTLLMGIVETGATVVIAREVADLAGCDLAFTIAPQSGEALDAGVDDVVAVSLAPFGGRAGASAPLPTMVLDAGEELPSQGDHYRGPGGGGVELDGAPAQLLATDLGPQDRVLMDGSLAHNVPALLATLGAGASVLLCPGEAPTAEQLAAEGVTVRGSSLAGTPQNP